MYNISCVIWTITKFYAIYQENFPSPQNEILLAIYKLKLTLVELIEVKWYTPCILAR